MPFIARWPGHVPAGRVDERSVLNIVDFAPTFCRLAGASTEQADRMDGFDISDALQGGEFKRLRPLFWHHPTRSERTPTLAVRDGDWKLVRYDPHVDGDNGNATQAKLYNLADDIGEKNDLIAEHADKAQMLQTKWNKWNESNVAPRWGKNGRQLRNANRRAASTSNRSQLAPTVN